MPIIERRVAGAQYAWGTNRAATNVVDVDYPGFGYADCGPYILINGKSFPMPMRGLNVKTITVVNSGRSANGVVISQRIGRDQQKIDALKWGVLRAETWSEMLQEFEKFELTITYPDPVTNDWTTRLMYPGDRQGTPWRLNSRGMPEYYINCTCNIIDIGQSDTNLPVPTSVHSTRGVEDEKELLASERIPKIIRQKTRLARVHIPIKPG